MLQRLSKDGARGGATLTRESLENINNLHSKCLFISECSEASFEKMCRSGCPAIKVRLIKSVYISLYHISR